MELPRRPDVNMTMRYAHPSKPVLGDQAAAFARLPTPGGRKKSAATPGGAGNCGGVCQHLTVTDEMEAGGIEPPSCER